MNEINLKKMSKLLNNKEDTQNLQSNESDLNIIINYKGKYIGINGTSLDFKDNLESLKLELQEAKGIYIKFLINEKVIMSSIGDIINQINQYINDNTDLIFTTEINNNVNIDIYEYQILLTGLR